MWIFGSSGCILGLLRIGGQRNVRVGHASCPQADRARPGAGGDEVAALGPAPARLAHAAAQGGIVRRGGRWRRATRRTSPARKPVSPWRIISGWTPTGLATTGRPAAMYCSTLRPHLPRLHRSSGIQLMPMSPAARSSASRRRAPRAADDAAGVEAREAVADDAQPQPRHVAAQRLEQRRDLLQPLQRTRRADPDQFLAVARGFRPGRPGSATGSTQVGMTRTRAGAVQRAACSARKSLPATTASQARDGGGEAAQPARRRAGPFGGVASRGGRRRRRSRRSAAGPAGAAAPAPSRAAGGAGG